MSFARALLDSGSQRNFMTEKFARKLECEFVPEYLRVESVCTGKMSSMHAVTVTVHPRSPKISQVAGSMKFHLLNEMTSKLPVTQFDVERSTLPNVQLADPLFNRSTPVDIILGAEAYNNLLRTGRIKLGETGPLMQNTALGWIISGDSTGISRNSTQVRRRRMNRNHKNCTVNGSIVVRFVCQILIFIKLMLRKMCESRFQGEERRLKKRFQVSRRFDRAVFVGGRRQQTKMNLKEQWCVGRSNNKRTHRLSMFCEMKDPGDFRMQRTNTSPTRCS